MKKLNPAVFVHAAEIADSNEHYFGACNAIHVACCLRGESTEDYVKRLEEMFKPEAPREAYWFGPVRLLFDDEDLVREANQHRALSLLFLAEMAHQENNDNQNGEPNSSPT